MEITDLHTRVLSVYANGLVAPSCVAIKRELMSTTGWMTSVLNQSVLAVNTTTTNAANAKASADASQVSANASQASAEDSAAKLAIMKAWITSFNKRWLGEQASDPTTDGNGDPLEENVEYYNTTTNHTRIYRNGAWHDQDETTEQEMSAASVSAANAAASNASAMAANNAAQAANNATQSALSSVNKSMFWLNTWWLGPANGNPSKDLNGQGVTPGATYYDTNANKLKTWNGNNWFTVATSNDIDLIYQSFVKTDGSNHMTGPLTLDLTNSWQGISTVGNISNDGNWFASPFLLTTLTGPINASSGFRTSYTKSGGASYLDLFHSSTVAGKTGGVLFVWDDGRVSTGGNIIAGDSATGTATVMAKDFKATNGDIAELYKSLEPLEAGTVVSISFNDDPEDELALATSRDYVFGVVSTDPGLLINNKVEDGYPVALCGRVPVRCISPVKKGYPIYLSIEEGLATANRDLAEDLSPIGFALESDTFDGEKLVEVALRF